MKSSIVSDVPLRMIAYEGYFSQDVINANPKLEQHVYNLIKLNELGFEIGNKPIFISDDGDMRKSLTSYKELIETGNLEHIETYIMQKNEKRAELDYEIDGLVFKINELEVRELLGYTSHHPRWAIAYKFESPMAETTLLDISIQIGRNGRVTPVAELEPVKIAGSVISRATLHNSEYIDLLDLGIGDTVSISKRGDVIPAVEEVIIKNPDGFNKFKFPDTCPFCSEKFIKEGAHHFCVNKECPERMKRTIIYFASKGQMDIESLGDKTIMLLYDKGYIRDVVDIYSIDYKRLLTEDGFKEKKIKNIRDSIEKSKAKPFATVLSALSFDGIGKSRAEELIANGLNSIEKIIDIANNNDVQALIEIDGVGDILAKSIISQFKDEKRIEQIEKLKKLGLNFKQDYDEEKDSLNSDFSGQIWVITGTFEHFKPRTLATKEIKKRGGKISSSVSSKTTYLLAGESAGSKLKKAEKLKVQIVNETKFLKMLKGDLQ
jgi:DNA ligase (NAD+)